jgi:hypothetical protein
MSRLSQNQSLVYNGVVYTVVDIVQMAELDSSGSVDEVWPWYVLADAAGARLIVEEDDGELSLYLREVGEGSHSFPVVDTYNARFSSTSGRAADLEGSFTCYEGPGGSPVLVGDRLYRTYPVMLGEDGQLRRVFAESPSLEGYYEVEGSDPERELDFSQESTGGRIADYVGLAVVPVLGLLALFAMRFNFTVLFLLVGVAALLATRWELGGFQRTLHAIAAATGLYFVAMPVAFIADLWGTDQVLMATMLSIFVIPIALNHHKLLRDMAHAAWWTSWAAVLVPACVLVFWCLVDEDFSWFSDWLDFFYYCSFILPVLYLISLFEGGRAWLRSLKSKSQ